MWQFGIDTEKHQTEPGRIASQADFFAKDSDFKVLSFWDWDKSLNPIPNSGWLDLRELFGHCLCDERSDVVWGSHYCIERFISPMAPRHRQPFQ